MCWTLKVSIRIPHILNLYNNLGCAEWGERFFMVAFVYYLDKKVANVFVVTAALNAKQQLSRSMSGGKLLELWSVAFNLPLLMG